MTMRRLVVALLLGVAATPVLGQGVIPDRRTPPVYAASVPEGRADVAPALPTGPVTTLHDAIIRAYWTNPTLLAERATLRATDPLYPAARALYGPQVSLQGAHSFARDRIQYAPGVWSRAQGFSSTASVIFNQEVVGFGRRTAGEQNALAQIALEREQVRLVESNQMLLVITAYVSVIRDRQQVELARQNLDLLEKQYGDSTERYRVHEITSSDLQQVETRLAFGRAQLLGAQGQLGQSQAQFVAAIGGVAGDLHDPDPLDPGVATLDQAYAIAEQNSPVVRGAQAREKVSRAGIAAARAEQYPDVALQASGTYAPTSVYENRLRTTEVRAGAVVTVPLIDSGVRRAAIERAKQTNDSDWQLIDAALRDAREHVAASWDQYRSALASLDHDRVASDAAQKAYDGAVIQEKAGARTTLDVLDLARDLLTVRTDYVAAQADEIIARAGLLAAMGNLEGPKLVPSIVAYDRDQNFDRQKHRGDVPLMTPALSAIDKPFGRRADQADRPIRDPYGEVRAETAVTYQQAGTVAAPSVAQPMSGAAPGTPGVVPR